MSRANGDDFALPDFDDEELAFEDTDFGVPLGVLFENTDFGVALLADCGVLRLLALHGVPRFFDREAKNSLFAPGCLDILLQV